MNKEIHEVPKKDSTKKDDAKKDKKSTAKEIVMELTIKEVSKLANPAARIAKSNILLGKEGYWFGWFSKRLMEHAQAAEKARGALVEKCALKDANGKVVASDKGMGLVSLDPEQVDLYNTKFRELMETIVSIPMHGPWEVNIDDLTITSQEAGKDGKVKEIKSCLLTPEEMLDLEKIIAWKGI